MMTKRYRILQLDKSVLGGFRYSFLSDCDLVFYFGDWRSVDDISTPIRSLVSNFKKTVSAPSTQKHYMNRSIEVVERGISSFTGLQFDRTLFLPVPPSKLKGDPEYRPGAEILGGKLKASKGMIYDFNNLTRRQSRNPLHQGGGPRPAPQIATQELSWGGPINSPDIDWVMIFDDVITSGSSVKAAEILAKQHLPNANVLFVAIGMTINT